MWLIILLILFLLVSNYRQLDFYFKEKFKPSHWRHLNSGRPYDYNLEFPYFIHRYDYVNPFPFEYEFHPNDLE